MKNAIILHGTGCTPNSYWIPYIKKHLEQNGYSLWVPQLPEPDTPDLKLQLSYVLKNGKFNKDTILIGHSAGGPLILGILDNIDVKIKKAILVAGYARPKGTVPQPEKILQKRYNKYTNRIKAIINVT